MSPGLGLGCFRSKVEVSVWSACINLQVPQRQYAMGYPPVHIVP